MSSPLTGPILAFAARLRFPTLFWITAGLFVFDSIIPDFIPFVDEILLGLGALILSQMQKPVAKQEGRTFEHEPPPPPPK